MIDKILSLWCRLWHDEPMLPVHGRYECRVCQRRFPVRWEAQCH